MLAKEADASSRRCRRPSSASWPGCTSGKGLSRETARKVAEELTEHDALAAHAEAEFGIDPDDLTNPWHAACASMVAFTVGGAAAAARDHADARSSVRVVGHRRDGRGRAGRHRLRPGPARARARAGARWPATSRGGLLAMARHVRRRERSSARTSERPMRMFVAVVPPPEAVEHLDEFLEVRRAAAAFRWAPAEQLHVTLAFLADVPDRKLDDLRRAAGRAAATRRTPFATAVAGGGAFPNAGRARVLWAGLDLDERRPHRAVPAGDRCPGGGQPGRRTGRRPAVPPARHRRPARPPRRGDLAGSGCSTPTAAPPGPSTGSPSSRRTSVRAPAAAPATNLWRSSLLPG